MNKTIEIPTINLAGFAAKINKLVAKATKLGCGAAIHVARDFFAVAA